VVLKEGSGQSFKKGEFVYLDGNGLVVICGSDPALILGIAEKDATGTANSACPVILAAPGVLFVGCFDNGSASVAVTQASIGKAYGIAVTSAKWYVDSTDTTNDRAVVWEAWDGDGQAIGDYLQWVIFSILFANYQFNVGT
jgi:hypothetical protein